ncbi:MAG: four helix bundle protein [bacterium]|nr:four helix bundle protein [bacterium]
MKIKKFEDLECWKEAHKLVKMVYDAIKANPGLSKDLRFSGQFSSAAVSSMSNIAEGFARETDKEFLRGLWISKGSTAEVQSLCYAALDQKYLTMDRKETIYNQAEKVSQLVSGLIKYLNKSARQHI